MRVKADITREDYWNFNKYAIFNVPYVRTTFILSALILPIVVLVIELLKNLSPSVIVVSMPVSTAAGFLLMIYITKKQAMGLPDKKEGLIGEHIFEIGKSGFKEITSVSRGSVSWNGVKSIMENEEYIFIFKDKMMGHIIPKRAFSSPEEAKEFYNKAISLWEAGKKK